MDSDRLVILKANTIKKTKKSLLVNEGIILGIISFLGYLCSYYYELGFKSYYYIPDMYVEVSLNTIVKCIVYILVVIIFMIMIANLLLSIIPKVNNTQLRSTISKFVWASAFGGLLVLINKFEVKTLKYYFITIGIFSFVVFILPLVTQRKIRGYANKLKTAEEKRLKPDSSYTLINILFNKYGKSGIYIMTITIFVIASIPNITYIGKYIAAKQEYYLVIKKPVNMVVLGTYKDNVIVANVDLEKKQIIPVYKFIKTENIEAEIIKVGPLKVQNNNTANISKD